MSLRSVRILKLKFQVRLQCLRTPPKGASASLPRLVLLSLFRCLRCWLHARANVTQELQNQGGLLCEALVGSPGG